jgi:carbamoyl-phosphate synthase large subunit
MKSTGEVLGMAPSFGLAFFKAQDAAQSRLPLAGTVLITVADKDKTAVIDVARRFENLGFTIMATSGTQNCLSQHGISSQLVNKMHENRPHIADLIKNGDIHIVINTPRGKTSKTDDSYIRKAAIRYKVPYVTTVAAALAAARGIEACRNSPAEVKSLQHYHADFHS